MNLNLNNSADRIRNDEKTNAIRRVFALMAQIPVTLEDLIAYKEVKSCGTGEYSRSRHRHKSRVTSRARRIETSTSNVFKNENS